MLPLFHIFEYTGMGDGKVSLFGLTATDGLISIEAKAGSESGAIDLDIELQHQDHKVNMGGSITLGADGEIAATSGTLKHATGTLNAINWEAVLRLAK